MIYFFGRKIMISYFTYMNALKGEIIFYIQIKTHYHCVGIKIAKYYQCIQFHKKEIIFLG